MTYDANPLAAEWKMNHDVGRGTRGDENGIVQGDPKEGNRQEVREEGRGKKKGGINAYFEAGLIEITVNHVYPAQKRGIVREQAIPSTPSEI